MDAATPGTMRGSAVRAEQAEVQSRIEALETVRASLLADRAARQAAASKSTAAGKLPRFPTQRHSGGAATTTGQGGERQSFEQLLRGLPGAVGIAYAPVGDPTQVMSFGELSSEVAWSTMKVPVAIAAVEATNGSPSAQTKKLMVAAITRSDNAAAEALWKGLGTPPVAARRTQSILRASGDGSTVVQAQRVRAGFTAFGQTHWTLQRQAGFAATLPCDPASASVLSLMRHITPEQRWGLGTLATNPAFKGGWGPDANGAYVVRQMGVVSLSDGTRLGVALAAKPSDGSFATGTRYLGELAEWLADNVRSGGGSC